MRSITTLDLQYAHRFYGFEGEASTCTATPAHLPWKWKIP